MEFGYDSSILFLIAKCILCFKVKCLIYIHIEKEFSCGTSLTLPQINK